MTSDPFAIALAKCPLVAILRGIQPHEARSVGLALAEVGFSLIEVPLNSPDPLRSIEALRDALGPEVLVGAGTVLTPLQVEEVASAGGQLIVSPNTDIRVIDAARSRGLISLPGCQTPTEAFRSLEAGARGLKLFPAEALSPSVLKAFCAVIPQEVPKLVVGGISPTNMQPWLDAGASGFGLGSGLYRKGDDATKVRESAEAYLAGLKRNASND